MPLANGQSLVPLKIDTGKQKEAIDTRKDAAKSAIGTPAHQN